jgi:hypothetical protein
MLAEHLVVALFRDMHGIGQSPRVRVVGRDADAWVASLRARLPQLDEIGTLAGDPRPGDGARICAAYGLDAAAADSAADLPPHVPFYWLAAGPPPAGAIPVAAIDWRRIADTLFDDPLDARARAIHGFYYEQSLRDGDRPGCRPSMLPWEDLPERYRQTSRYQADHVPIKLGDIACRETAMTGDGRLRFTADEVEALARVEHRRWSAVQMLDGWRYGPIRDDTARTTPYLLPFDQLAPEIQDRDRMPVRQRPAQLARIGHGVRRDAVIVMTADPGIAPGGRFRRAFARLLREIADHYPDRTPMLTSRLTGEAERQAAGVALETGLARLTLLLDAGNETDPALRPFFRRASRLRRSATPWSPAAPSLHVHIGEMAPPVGRLVAIDGAGRIGAAPWL